MEILCSLKSYYNKGKLNRILSNMFLFSMVLTYLLPPILAIAGFDKLSGILLEFTFKTLKLDPVITAPLIMVFIVIYTFFILGNKRLGTIYSLILFLNLVFVTFGMLMFTYSFAYKDILVLLPLGFLIVLLLIFNKFEKYKCEKSYKINNLFAFLSIIVPVTFLNFIGRFIFSFLI